MRAAVSDYELTNAESLPRALELLGQGAGWRPMAGGTDLMVLFNAGKLPFRRLVSICGVPELRAIEVSRGAITIGAAVTFSEIGEHPALQSDFPLLCVAANWTGGRANQNRGTLGGNLANASPAADSAPVLLAYDAELELASTRGVRRLLYSEFHLGYKKVRMEPDELITRIRLQRPGGERTQYARKVGTRGAQAISKVCLAAVCERSGDLLRQVRIGMASVAPTPLRCFRTEGVLESRLLTAELAEEAKHTLRYEISPITDLRSTSEYRAQVAVNLLSEFLERLR